jgi:hypothetical protein
MSTLENFKSDITAGYACKGANINLGGAIFEGQAQDVAFLIKHSSTLKLFPHVYASRRSLAHLE